MVLETSSQYAENTHCLGRTQDPEYLEQSRRNSDWTSGGISCRTISWHHGIEIEIPSPNRTERTSWVMICQGKKRYVDELHIPNPEYNLASSELLTQRSIAEGAPCYIQLKQSSIEETRAEPSKNPTDSLCHTKSIIPLKEKKWKSFPLYPSFKGRTLSTAISKFVM